MVNCRLFETGKIITYSLHQDKLSTPKIYTILSSIFIPLVLKICFMSSSSPCYGRVMNLLQDLLQLVALLSMVTPPIVLTGFVLTLFQLLELWLHVQGITGTWFQAWWGWGCCGSLALCPGSAEARYSGLFDTVFEAASDNNVLK